MTITASDVAGTATTTTMNYTLGYTKIDDTTGTATGTKTSSDFGVNTSEEPRQVNITLTLCGQEASTTITQSGKVEPSITPLFTLFDSGNIAGTTKINGVSPTSSTNSSYTIGDDYVTCSASGGNYRYSMIWSGFDVASVVGQITKSSGATFIAKLYIDSVSSNQYQAIIGTHNNFSTSSNNGGNINNTYYSINGGSQDTSSSSILGKWVIISSAFKFDGSSTANRNYTYDANTKTLLKSFLRTWNWPGETSTPQNSFSLIGLTTSQNSISAKIKDVKVYNQTLTKEEIEDIIALNY